MKNKNKVRNARKTIRVDIQNLIATVDSTLSKFCSFIVIFTIKKIEKEKKNNKNFVFKNIVIQNHKTIKSSRRISNLSSN